LSGCPNFDFSSGIGYCRHYNADYDDSGDYQETCGLSCKNCKDIPECEHSGEDEPYIRNYE
jgi:hypothetical protein